MAWKQRRWTNISICRVCIFGLTPSVQQKTSTFFALSFSYPGCSHVGSLFTSGDQEGLVRDVTDTSAAQADQVQDITCTEWRTQNCSAQGIVSMPLKHVFFVFVFTSLPLPGNADHPNRHCSCKNSITQTSRCVQYFCVSKQWYSCQCLGFLMLAQMLMHVIAHMGCMDILRECALEAHSGRKIPCHNKESNPCKYCACLFSQTLYQLSYSCPKHDFSTN